jgi:hypothetical protein
VNFYGPELDFDRAAEIRNATRQAIDAKEANQK